MLLHLILNQTEIKIIFQNNQSKQPLYTEGINEFVKIESQIFIRLKYHVFDGRVRKYLDLNTEISASYHPN
jgi:hypothetical protein